MISKGDIEDQIEIVFKKMQTYRNICDESELEIDILLSENSKNLSATLANLLEARNLIDNMKEEAT